MKSTIVHCAVVICVAVGMALACQDELYCWYVPNPGGQVYYIRCSVKEVKPYQKSEYKCTEIGHCRDKEY